MALLSRILPVSHCGLDPQPQPPLLNFPAQRSIIAGLTRDLPQQITFSWVARGFTPNMSSGLSYRFRLLEIEPAGGEPNANLFTLRPLYETITNQTALFYGIGEPPLQYGRRYAWQVQAIEASGRDYFENSGLSEVYAFVYGSDCGEIAPFDAEAGSPYVLMVAWQSGQNHRSYTYRYREAGAKEWRSIAPQITEKGGSYQAYLSGMQPNTTYEVQIVASCAGSGAQVGSTESPVRRVTTPAVNTDIAYECGRPAVNTVITDFVNRESLKVGDTLRVSDFNILITKVSKQSNGRFEGEAEVVIPFFNEAVMPMVFKNIAVNQAGQVISGINGDNHEFYSKPTIAKLAGIPDEWLQWAEDITNVLNDIDNALAQAGPMIKQIDDYLDKYQGDDKLSLKALWQQIKEAFQGGKREMKEGKDEVERGRGKRRLAGAIGQIGQFLRQLGQGGLQRLLNDLERWVREVLEGLRVEATNKRQKNSEDYTRLQKEYDELRPKVVQAESEYKMLSDLRNNNRAPTGNKPTTTEEDELYPDFSFAKIVNTPEAIALEKNIAEIKKISKSGRLLKLKLALVITLLDDPSVFAELIAEMQKDIEKIVGNLLQDFLNNPSPEALKTKIKDFLEAKIEQFSQLLLDEK